MNLSPLGSELAVLGKSWRLLAKSPEVPEQMAESLIPIVLLFSDFVDFVLL